jgi:very-short-patch-repair endonuclease
MEPVSRARLLRRKQTWAEKALWRLLRDRRFSGYKFRRQHPLGRYYLDFYCAEARLVLETDGFGHGFPGQQKHDAQRDEFLRSQGIMVKRIWNWQLRRQLEWVRYNLWKLLQERAPHPGNVPPARRVTSRVLNPDHPPSAPVLRRSPDNLTTFPKAQQSSTTQVVSPSPHPMGRGSG